MSRLVVIPARAGSRRLPLKPLLPIAGVSLLHRTIAYARRALAQVPDADLMVATDDPAIVAHADQVGCRAVMTEPAISSGSGRALAAARQERAPPDIIVNLQGDAPFQPIGAPAALLQALSTPEVDVATPVVRLSWEALDALRDHKRTAPFSGTTCARAANSQALWFSKTIIPAIRDEDALRGSGAPCPVWRHIGIYGYRRHALERFEAAPATELETLEGLEQLRLLELGLRVEAVAVAPAPFDISGIDTPADIARAEALIAAHGDPHH